MCKNEKFGWFIAFIIGCLTGFFLMWQYNVHEATSEIIVPEGDAVQGEFLPFAGAIEVCAVNLEDYSAEIEESHVEVVEATEPEPEPEMTSLGEFRITYYDNCEECCGDYAGLHTTFTGTTTAEGRTIAVDPDVIPLGSTVVIYGEEYIAEDTGAFSGNQIDIYVEEHSTGYEYLRERGDTTEVFIKEDN